MKDERKRRRKVELPLIKTLLDVDSSAVFTPVHQESLDMDCKYVYDMATQGEEFLATSSDEWWLKVYGLRNEDSTSSFDRESISETSDDAVIPNNTRKALWRTSPRDPGIDPMGNVTFLAPDVLGLVQLQTSPATVSTWNLRSGQFLESIIFRGAYAFQTMCKITDTKFLLGDADGHLFSFEHEGGFKLRETGRIWRAHAYYISSLTFHNGTILTTSGDWSARLWNAETKKRLAVLYHDGKVFSGAMSDQYIVTSSEYDQSDWQKRELRIFRNSEGYPLAKILRAREAMVAPTFLDDGRVLCILRGHMDEDYDHLVRDTLVVVDFENERMLARLKVGCRTIAKYKVLSDGRLVAIGHGGCRGVITTLPRGLGRLISPKTSEKQSKIGRRRMCTLM